ncbi:hypothetical protein B0T11DRAFT_84718 [Plectosphaerella cucumerina]|uniref:Uncharacterized protein n=1 Tax=Plectosphaerella cucumerina TaxID=40658 RepID=A0A8K0THB3_9PEZI|nr:hypothetical protein B0T11DRAFT_84718 [Plectosphaerella cucumerina]
MLRVQPSQTVGRSPSLVACRSRAGCRRGRRRRREAERALTTHPSREALGFAGPWWCGDLSSSVDSLRAREAMQDLWRLQVHPAVSVLAGGGQRLERDSGEEPRRTPRDGETAAEFQPISTPIPSSAKSGRWAGPIGSGAIVGAKVTVASDESVSCLLSFSLPEATTGQPFVQVVPQSRQPLAPSGPGRRLKAAAWREAARLV